MEYLGRFIILLLTVTIYWILYVLVILGFSAVSVILIPGEYVLYGSYNKCMDWFANFMVHDYIEWVKNINQKILKVFTKTK